MTEEWTSLRDSDGCHGDVYEISSFGRVKSKGRWVNHKGIGKAWRRECILSPFTDANGYVRIGLTIAGKGRQRMVHRLVAYSFHGDPSEPSMEACHGDGDRGNPSKDNIRWDTKAGNAADKVKHGRANTGSSNPRATITDDRALRIVARAEAGEEQRAIAADLGLPLPTVNHIVTGKTWSAVTKRKYSRRHAAVTPEIIERMGQLRLAGNNLHMIAEQLGISHPTVFRHYKKAKCLEGIT